MSEVRANTVSNGAGTGPATLTKQWAAKAVVAVNQQGTQAIIHSSNISSITDAGVGITDANLTSAMSSSNYTPLVASRRVLNWLDGGDSNTQISTKMTLNHVENTSTADTNQVSAAGFGDLA